MNYELKFYFGNVNDNEVTFLGSYKLADEATFNHYKNLINSGIPFSIWFEHYDNEYCHRNFLVNHLTAKADGLTDDDKTTAYFFINSDIESLKFLTREQFKNEYKINELINQLSRENISRYFR